MTGSLTSSVAGGGGAIKPRPLLQSNKSQSQQSQQQSQSQHSQLQSSQQEYSYDNDTTITMTTLPPLPLQYTVSEVTRSFKLVLPGPLLALAQLLMDHTLPQPVNHNHHHNTSTTTTNITNVTTINTSTNHNDHTATGSASSRVPDVIRAYAFVAIGKFCLRDKGLARNHINLFLRELTQASQPAHPYSGDIPLSTSFYVSSPRHPSLSTPQVTSLSLILFLYITPTYLLLLTFLLFLFLSPLRGRCGQGWCASRGVCAIQRIADLGRPLCAVHQSGGSTCGGDGSLSAGHTRVGQKVSNNI